MKHKIRLAVLGAFCFIATGANAQFKVWEKINKGLDEGTKIAYKLAVLTKLTGMTTAEFNQTVKVIKGNEANNRVALKK